MDVKPGMFSIATFPQMTYSFDAQTFNFQWIKNKNSKLKQISNQIFLSFFKGEVGYFIFGLPYSCLALRHFMFRLRMDLGKFDFYQSNSQPCYIYKV